MRLSCFDLKSFSLLLDNTALLEAANAIEVKNKTNTSTTANFKKNRFIPTPLFALELTIKLVEKKLLRFTVLYINFTSTSTY